MGVERGMLEAVIAEHPPMEHMAENSLIIKAQGGNVEARNTLVKHHLQFLIGYVSRRYPSRALDEVLAAASLGMMRAIEKHCPFRYNQPHRLIGYAKYFVHAFVGRQMDQEDGVITMPYNYRHREKVPVNPNDTMRSLDRPVSEESDTTLYDLVPHPESADLVQQRINKTMVHRALNTLSAKHRELIELRYGLTDAGEHTYQEIANKLGYATKESVSVIHKYIMDKLKRQIESQRKE